MVDELFVGFNTFEIEAEVRKFFGELWEGWFLVEENVQSIKAIFDRL